MITFQAEKLSQIKPDLMGLLNAHWEEIALDKGVIKLDPDWEGYENLENMGRLHFTTVRADGVLVGYYVNIVMPHPHYRKSLTAYSDIFFLHKDYRKGLTGVKLIKTQERFMKALGVQKIYAMEKVHSSIAKIWEHLGYKHIENTYSKVI